MPNARNSSRLLRFAGDVVYVIGSLLAIAVLAPIIWVADRMERSA
ncbi:hypothetical protein [Pseudoclavibacter sp. RFBG4]|nr:hypothetical protein [Pseudoclavibacter sp. RFBG4]